MPSKDETIYHIYAKDRCLYNCLKEEEFEVKWSQLNAMVGLMHTEYDVKDLSYEKLPAGIGGAGTGTVTWKEPDGGDSY